MSVTGKRVKEILLPKVQNIPAVVIPKWPIMNPFGSSERMTEIWCLIEDGKKKYYSPRLNGDLKVHTADGEDDTPRAVRLTYKGGNVYASPISYIGGLTGYTERDDSGRLKRVGVWYDVRLPYYVMKQDEAEAMFFAYPYRCEWQGDASDTDIPFDTYRDMECLEHGDGGYYKRVYDHVAGVQNFIEQARVLKETSAGVYGESLFHSEVTLDLENRRLYCRHDNVTPFQEFIYGSGRKGSTGISFRTFSFYSADDLQTLSAILRYMPGFKAMYLPLCWPDVFRGKNSDSERETAFSSLILDYFYEKVSGEPGFESYVKEPTISRAVKNAAAKYMKRFRALHSIPSDAEPQRKRWQELLFFCLEPSLPWIYAGKDYNDVLTSSKISRSAYDKQLRSFHLRSRDLFAEARRAYVDYPSTKTAREALYKDFYGALLCWSTCRRFRKKTADDFNAVWIYSQSLSNRRRTRFFYIMSTAAMQGYVEKSVLAEFRTYMKTRTFTSLFKSKWFGSDPKREVRDAFVMYRKLKSRYGLSVCIAANGKPFSRLDYMELHKEASELGAKLSMARVEIHYSDERIRQFDRTYGEYSFSLVRDTIELVRLGQNLKNCVGSLHYEPYCSEDEHIVEVKDKNGRYAACISIDRNWRNFLEIKGYENTYLQGSLAKAARAYIAGTGLKLSNSARLDVCHMNCSGTAFGAPADYHRREVRLDENGKEVIVDLAT